MDKSIMRIFITTHERAVLHSNIGTVVMVPFEGRVESDFFTGKVMQGAVDRQIIDANKIKHMSARYMLCGTDKNGEDCKIYIENQGDFHIDAPRPFKTIPTFYTDSKTLSPYLQQNKFRATGHRENDVLVITIYEIISE